MYGAITGDLAGFPYENHPVDLTDRNIPLIPASEGEAGNTFSDKTVLTAALEEGLLRFENRMPEVLEEKRKKTAGDPSRPGPGAAAGFFEGILTEELTAAFRRFGTVYPLAGYTMDMSIWLFREGAAPGLQAEPGPAARVSPIAWMFQDDLYMMRHMARLQARLTNRGEETVRAADAAACIVFLALHGCTKDYVTAFMGREFGYRITDEGSMREEVLRGGRTSSPAVCVRAALTAFLYGTDFEDVVRRAVSIGGSCADIAAVAGAAAEAFFGIPEKWKEVCRGSLPEDLRASADAFAERMELRRIRRETDPAAKKRWENALIRASERHPAAVQGNEELENAIARMLEKRDQQSLLLALEMLRLRMQQKGRVLVPLLGARRAEKAEISGTPVGGAVGDENKPEQPAGPDHAMVYRLQTLRTRDGKLWQPAYTSRRQMEKAPANREMQEREQNGEGVPERDGERRYGKDRREGMALSWSIEALLRSFMPEERNEERNEDGGEAARQRKAPPEIAGVVLNPYDRALYLPRKTIEAVFVRIPAPPH